MRFSSFVFALAMYLSAATASAQANVWVIETVAGIGPNPSGCCSDLRHAHYTPTQATNVQLGYVSDVVVGPSGKIYFLDSGDVGVVDPATGEVDVYAYRRYLGCRTPIVDPVHRLDVTNGVASYARSLAVDANENIYIGSSNSYCGSGSRDSVRVTRIDHTTDLATTFSGGATNLFTPYDLSPATTGGHDYVSGMAWFQDARGGELYIADRDTELFAGVSTGAIVAVVDWLPMTNFTTLYQTTIWSYSTHYPADGLDSRYAPAAEPSDVAIDPLTGDVYYIDMATSLLRRIDRQTRTVTTVVDLSKEPIILHGGPNTFRALAIDTSGNAYVASYRHAIFRIKLSTGKVSVFAGQQGVAGYAGDGGLPQAALLDRPEGLHWANGKLYVADYGNDVVRVIFPMNLAEGVCGDGIVQTLAGEQCDDGNTNNFDGCNNNCRITFVPPEGWCGDGIVAFNEQCDDGNNINGDGCNQYCQVETGYVGTDD